MSHIGGHLEITQNKKYCIVGDIHGRVKTLEKIIEKSPGYHFILIGDCIHHKPFFKKYKKVPSIKVLNFIKQKVSNGQVTLLLGNHENYILKNLVTPSKDILKTEVKNTLRSLRELEFNKRLDMISWLSRCPLTATITTESGKKINLAHGLFKKQVTKNNRNTILHGPGFPWWKDKLEEYCPNSDEQYVLGHYGYPYMRKNLLILDATNFEGVGTYYVDREEFMIYY